MVITTIGWDVTPETLVIYNDELGILYLTTVGSMESSRTGQVLAGGIIFFSSAHAWKIILDPQIVVPK